MTPGPSRPADHLDVLVTLPVRNEVTRLVEALDALQAEFARSGLSFRLSVAEDGSTDGTKELLRKLPTRYPGLIVQEEPKPLGRGRALRQLWARLDADVYCFTDTDLAAGAEALLAAVRSVRAGHPIVVGSRYAAGACTHRPPVRSIVSRGYNLLLRTLFHERIQDHQCGLKAFNREALRWLLPLTKEDSWFWDSEILIIALRDGIPVVEMPVHWTERKVTRTHWQRLASDVLLHGVGILKLKARINSLPAITSAVRSAIGLVTERGREVPDAAADT